MQTISLEDFNHREEFKLPVKDSIQDMLETTLNPRDNSEKYSLFDIIRVLEINLTSRQFKDLNSQLFCESFMDCGSPNLDLTINHASYLLANHLTSTQLNFVQEYKRKEP